MKILPAIKKLFRGTVNKTRVTEGVGKYGSAKETLTRDFGGVRHDVVTLTSGGSRYTQHYKDGKLVKEYHSEFGFDEAGKCGIPIYQVGNKKPIIHRPEWSYPSWLKRNNL